ncbi:hypothetical protein EI94DRAFT_410974 [Lactarius quietus]|nr:hypothetical protein EI94DRAFT_410974 [Lactarius quietus]
MICIPYPEYPLCPGSPITRIPRFHIQLTLSLGDTTQTLVMHTTFFCLPTTSALTASLTASSPHTSSSATDGHPCNSSTKKLYLPAPSARLALIHSEWYLSRLRPQFLAVYIKRSKAPKLPISFCLILGCVSTTFRDRLSGVRTSNSLPSSTVCLYIPCAPKLIFSGSFADGTGGTEMTENGPIAFVRSQCLSIFQLVCEVNFLDEENSLILTWVGIFQCLGRLGL